MNNNNVLEIKTVQIAPMKTLMTALKDILLENEIDSACVHLFDVERQFQINKKIDLVISLK